MDGEPISKSASIDTTKPTGKEVSTKTSNSDETKVFELQRKDFATYVGAAVYGYWENARAMAFDSPGIIDRAPEELSRATEGFQKLLDQNTGDGTIVALGFLGADIALLTVDNVSKKLGKKGINPTTRFLSSLTFGVGIATYLETTTIMNNVVDIPGDLFGVGLGAATILASKLAADHITTENVEKTVKRTIKVANEVPKKFQVLSKKIASRIKNMDESSSNESVAESLSGEFVELVEETGVNDIDINPSI